MSFNKLKLSPWILKTCESIRYYTPTPIQQLSIPSIIQGKSVIINSQTGSGKTAAFGLPLLEKLSREPYSVFAVIIAPSLQLAIQIQQQMDIFGQGINLRQALLVGGVNYSRQFEQIEKYPHIIIGTPGRLSEMITKSQKFQSLMKRAEVLVLDEADRMFEEKNMPNMIEIIQSMKGLKQILLATATIDENFEGKKLQAILQTNIDFIKFSTFQGKKTSETLTQSYIFTAEQLKPGYLLPLLDENSHSKTIVFAKTCKQCTLISQSLKKLNLPSIPLHSFMRNSQRIANLAMFRKGQAKILVTTDLTSRGLDIEGVTLVINFNIPKTVSDYVHRVGRTARNGYDGEAVTLVTPNQVNIFKNIEDQIGVQIEGHSLNEKPNLDLVSKFNKAKRQTKIHLSSCGVMEDLEKKKQKKLQMRTERLQM